MRTQTKIILLLILLLFLLAGITTLTKKKENTDVVACTMEAKICPDGSSVGRSGPMCEFAPCPGEADHPTWETSSDKDKNFSFKYPKDLGTTYITPADWPPVMTVSNDPFECTVAGSETARAGKTENKIINGGVYCVTKISEGAAGSVYTEYAYTSAIEGKAVTFTFSLKAVQCANYDKPKRSACENEQSTFNVDALVGEIGETFGPFSTEYKPQSATVVGEYICLPHVDTTGPQTDECALGIKTDVGIYYSLDFSLLSQSVPGLNVGDRISVNGVFTPVERLSSTWWKKYPIRGILSVSDIHR